MTKRPLKEVAASIRKRLQDKAQTTERPFQELLQYFAMERFLYRLAQSAFADKFVLKGALMFKVWGAPQGRPTKDIDLLGRMTNNTQRVTDAIREVCQQTVEPDGLVFDTESVAGALIKEDADYAGVRITFFAKLQNARIPMQIDVGFGDVISPSSQLTEYPTIFDLPAPKLQGYSRETAIAEKFEAMVKLDVLNSRMKDFFDIWLLLRNFDFLGKSLATAIEKTFANRGTKITAQPLALTAAFSDHVQKAVQWNAFIRKLRIQNAPSDLSVVIRANASFLGPIGTALADGQPFAGVWKAPGPWLP
jgi:predicted nucleotidyltransferase component of viral defense system